jgi:hypothetical protein
MLRAHVQSFVRCSAQNLRARALYSRRLTYYSLVRKIAFANRRPAAELDTRTILWAGLSRYRRWLCSQMSDKVPVEVELDSTHASR